MRKIHRFLFEDEFRHAEHACLNLYRPEKEKIAFRFPVT